ncbi:GTP-binding protein YsxC [Desulforamulus profundi]|uniref:Probable GTP-binding protein EngB n=1 Tax=Desulforamulus profundi TaxID=1383067 RepID=A0A2C6MCC5_9FIRM|nr:ribosome biogenesis GTP-binding protein YihA/YsxC [Desulforamulus profundi]PHJ36933.1 GTP-binding protein YsxC [Desulforamulus profundi]
MQSTPGVIPRGIYRSGLRGPLQCSKSSLINRLVNRKGLARTSKTPGRTQLINFFTINDKFLLVDLPGYGFAKVPEEVRAKWGKMIEGYLKNRETLKGVFLLLDCRHTPTSQDKQMYQWLLHYGVPTVVAATKIDKLSNNQWAKQQGVIKKTLPLSPEHRLIPFSSETGRGRDELLGVIKNWIHNTDS